MRLVLATLVLAAAPLAAQALTSRPDRDDAEYLELATHYPSAIAFAGGEGVLIASRWVLTSAAAAKALQAAPAKLRIAATDYDVESFVFPPDEGGIALLLLARPAKGVEPTPIHAGADETGKGVVIVGHGGGAARAAINTVDVMGEKRFELRIKALDEASDLQGAITAAERGAPAYLEAKGELSVAGIALAHTQGADEFARVSAFAAWIEERMLDVARQEADALLDSDRR